MFTLEFYIVMAVVAAAIVALAARPASHGPAEQHLLAGRLYDDYGDGAPELMMECTESGSVAITRRGIEGVACDGAVSLAVEVAGSDIRIEERIVPGRMALGPVQAAEFDLRSIRPGFYHVRYNSQPTGLFAAFPFHVAPGIRTSKTLAR